MRLWSLHPKYLDAKGLVAVWREGLLALAVLQGKTKGYLHHPQLERFSAHSHPIAAISGYLHFIFDEASSRGYSFQISKLPALSFQSLSRLKGTIAVTDGQLAYETAHLRKKLQQRNPQKLKELPSRIILEPHPLFRNVKGDIESWEKI